MVPGKSTTPRPSIASETSYNEFLWWFDIFHRWIKHSPVFTGQVRFSDKKKDLPGDIDSAIKALFELYDPMKKGAFAAWWLRNAFPGISHKQKDSLCVWCDAFAAFLDTWGTIGWPQFAEVDRIVTECLGGQYEEMISRRAFSMMNYPGLNTGIALRAFTQSQDRNFIKGFWQSWKLCAGFSSSVFNRTHPGVRDFIHNLPQLSCHLPWFLQCVFCTSSCLRSDALCSYFCLVSWCVNSNKAFVAKQMGALEGPLGTWETGSSGGLSVCILLGLLMVRLSEPCLAAFGWQVIEMHPCTTSTLWTRCVVLM